MSRPDKERRRRKRLDKRRRRSREEPVVIRLFNLTISYEPLREGARDVRGPTSVLSQDAAERLNWMVHNRPAEAIQPLRELLARHPDVPAFYNWLANACASTGRQAEAEELIRLSYERFPKYLFSRVTYAQLLLRRGWIEEVPAVAGHFDLKEIYPHRDLFHVSEFGAVAGLAVLYFVEIGEIDAAESWLNVLEDYMPDAEHLDALRSKLERARRPRITERVAAWLRPK